jgi:hypothetical protein
MNGVQRGQAATRKCRYFHSAHDFHQVRPRLLHFCCTHLPFDSRLVGSGIVGEGTPPSQIGKRYTVALLSPSH